MLQLQWKFLPEVSESKMPKLELSYTRNTYKQLFLGRNHSNYLAAESPLGPLAISLLKTDKEYAVIIRSREGVEFHSCERMSTWKRKLSFKEPSLEKILEEMNCFLPCSYLTICDDEKLPQSLLAAERELIAACQIGIFTQSTGEGYNSFLRWIFDIESDSVVSPNFDFSWNEYRFQFRNSVDAPILIVIQDEIENNQFIDNISSQIIVIVSREQEIDAFGLDVAVRSNLIDLIKMELPSPAIFYKSETDREFVLRLLLNGFSALSNSVYYPQLKNRRHTALYDLCKKFCE